MKLIQGKHVFILVMPGKTGHKLLYELRKAVTGYGGDKYGYEKFLSSRRLVPPPDGSFPRPIDPEPFLKAITELLKI